MLSLCCNVSFVGAVEVDVACHLEINCQHNNPCIYPYNKERISVQTYVGPNEHLHMHVLINMCATTHTYAYDQPIHS